MSQTTENKQKHYWQTLEECTQPQSFAIYEKPEFTQDRKDMLEEAETLKVSRKTFLKVMVHKCCDGAGGMPPSNGANCSCLI